MFFNNKGISVISLVITIIVLVLITTITVYQGINVLDESRVRMARDRLKTVATAIIAHEEELGFAGTVVGGYESGDESTGRVPVYKAITNEEYIIMGLEDFANSEEIPPIYVFKTTSENNPEQKIYHFKTPKTVKKNAIYNLSDYVEYEQTFYEKNVKENLKVEFDNIKGVNRPIITEDMTPVKMTFDEYGNSKAELVDDIFSNDWYDYSKTSPIWANVRMNNNRYYVWIPRFAYKLQDYYASTGYSDVSQGAIDIVFLKGNSDYMKNDEVLPGGYQVHPAFKFINPNTDSEVNIPGFWVAKYNVNNLVEMLYRTNEPTSEGLSALEEVELSKLHPDVSSSDMSSYLINNSQWAAIAYLSFYTTGKNTTGNSLINNASAVMDLGVKQFVAGGLRSYVSYDYFDVYDVTMVSSGERALYEATYMSSESNTRKYGDALIATSSGRNDNSAWFGGTSIIMTDDSPFIIRGMDSNLFAYASTARHPARGAGCRNVLIMTDGIDIKVSSS